MLVMVILTHMELKQLFLHPSKNHICTQVHNLLNLIGYQLLPLIGCRLDGYFIRSGIYPRLIMNIVYLHVLIHRTGVQ